MTAKHIRLLLTIGFVTLTTATHASQHQWRSPDRETGRGEPARPVTASPRGAITGSANGIFCPDMVDGAVGMHDLGWLPSGLNATVAVVSSGPATFDPVAAVVVASVGTLGGGNVKTTTFYDNDTGGDRDPTISFVTPQAGTYFLLVGENSGTGGGCYRYQVSIR